MKLTDTQQVIAYTVAAYIHRAAKENSELAVQDIMIACDQLIDKIKPADEPDPDDLFA